LWQVVAAARRARNLPQALEPAVARAAWPRLVLKPVEPERKLLVVSIVLPVVRDEARLARLSTVHFRRRLTLRAVVVVGLVVVRG
jgi:hypothetical protein